MNHLLVETRVEVESDVSVSSEEVHVESGMKSSIRAHGRI